MNKAFATVAATAFALAIGTTAASAVTLTVTDVAADGPGINVGGAPTPGFGDNFGQNAPSGATSVGGGTFVAPKPAVGSLGSTYDSPFDDEGIGYWVSGGDTGLTYNPGTSLINFAGGIFNLEMLWGSADTYNNISFYSGENGTGFLGSFTGTAVATSNVAESFCGGTTCPISPDDSGNYNLVARVLFNSDVAIKSITLQSRNAAFEYAFVPIPPAALLFGTALAGVGFMSRRKKAQAAA